MCPKRDVSFNHSSSIEALIEQLATLHPPAKAVVIAERPAVFLSVLRKRWLKTIRTKQRQRASTLDTATIITLDQEIRQMSRLCFTWRTLREDMRADIYVLDVGAIPAEFPTFCTLHWCAPQTSTEYTRLAAHYPLFVYEADT